MPTQIEPHKFPLLSNGEAELILDFNGGEFRTAFYFKPQGRKEKKRAATSDKNLSVALQKCFKENGSPFKEEPWARAKLVEEYIRATPWGSQLPA